eukprot:SAG31_NODE_84_length_27014_cov_3.743006_25_plen_73_part_00
MDPKRFSVCRGSRCKGVRSWIVSLTADVVALVARYLNDSKNALGNSLLGIGSAACGSSSQALAAGVPRPLAS